VLVAAGVVAAVRLAHTTVPGDLARPHLDVAREFPAHALHRAESFDAFVRFNGLLSQVALLVVLFFYARRGAVFARESAAGPIGTGFLLGMLGLGLVWFAHVPFGLADLWWGRRHGVLHTSYVDWLVEDFLGLGGEFLFVCFALLVVMGLARLVGRWWWVPASAAFVALFVAFTFVSPYLVPDLHAPRGAALRAQAAGVARAEGLAGVPLRIQKVHNVTTQPNAFSTGLGASRRVVLWDTITRFPRREVRVVMAHEYGHLARHHIAKEIGWFALLVIPASLIVALVTRRRGGLAQPAAVPLTLFVVAVLQLAATPLQAAASRRYEAEADWRALQTTHDPAAMRALFRRFTSRALADPDPPGWFHVLFEDHPTGLQRIAMADAWAARRARVKGP
jgi:STE24 endopeptidase